MGSISSRIGCQSLTCSKVTRGSARKIKISASILKPTGHLHILFDSSLLTPDKQRCDYLILDNCRHFATSSVSRVLGHRITASRHDLPRSRAWPPPSILWLVPVWPGFLTRTLSGKMNPGRPSNILLPKRTIVVY
jgi:hypothetical protein